MYSPGTQCHSGTQRAARWAASYPYALRAPRAEDYRDFQFDILMANPPFAGDIKETRIVHRYDLGFKADGKAYPKLGRDILFIERNLDFLKPGGQMAIVLPQGRFTMDVGCPADLMRKVLDEFL